MRNTQAGIALGNFNALDVWVWYSTFEDCAIGITNTPGAGNYHVYNSVFRRSTRSDLAMSNTGGFSARGNYGLRAFVAIDAVDYPDASESRQVRYVSNLFFVVFVSSCSSW